MQKVRIKYALEEENMRQNECLFKDNMSPEGMVSVSQIQTFLSCKKKWKYNYIDNIKPRVDRAYLTIGKLCHRGMQIAMMKIWEGEDWTSARVHGKNAIRDKMDEYIRSTPFLEEELAEVYQLKEDAIDIFNQAFFEFEPWKYEVLTMRKSRQNIPALELHFVVPCAGSRGLHGYIDAILKDKETGSVWCTDYKFRKSLSPDEDEDYNIQNAVYAYACEKMGVNITGTMTWQHVNTPAAEPKVNKNGTISTVKIKTTWEKYAEFCALHGQDPEKYRDAMEEKLAEIEWCRATYEYRNKETIEKIWGTCVVPVSLEIRHAFKANYDHFPSLYPWNCKMCQYQSLCQAELRGYDTKAILDREYVVREKI